MVLHCLEEAGKPRAVSLLTHKARGAGKGGVPPPPPPATAVAPALTSPSGDLSPAAPGSAAGPGRSAASGARHPPHSGKQRAVPGAAPPLPGLPRGLPGHPHLPWLRCNRPPHPPWGQTWETQVPLERQTAVTVLWGSQPGAPELQLQTHGDVPCPPKQTLQLLRISGPGAAAMLGAQCSSPRYFGNVDKGMKHQQSLAWWVATEQEHMAGEN